jgi:hypothetical protein
MKFAEENHETVGESGDGIFKKVLNNQIKVSFLPLLIPGNRETTVR